MFFLLIMALHTNHKMALGARIYILFHLNLVNVNKFMAMAHSVHLIINGKSGRIKLSLITFNLIILYIKIHLYRWFPLFGNRNKIFLNHYLCLYHLLCNYCNNKSQTGSRSCTLARALAFHLEGQGKIF